MFVVGSPGLFKHFTHTFAFFPLEPVSTGDARGPWNAVGSRVTISARGSCWTLQTAAKLQIKKEQEIDARTPATATVPLSGFYLFLSTFSLHAEHTHT